MKKRIAAYAASLLAALGMVVAVQAPASAASGSDCDWAVGVRVCVTLTWVPNGIVVTSVSHSTPDGCGNLEDSGGKYAYKAMDTSNGNYYWPTLGCSSSHGVYDGCGCTTRIVTVTMKRRVHLDSDVASTFTFYLHSNGAYEVSHYSWN